MPEPEPSLLQIAARCEQAKRIVEQEVHRIDSLSRLNVLLVLLNLLLCVLAVMLVLFADHRAGAPF